MSPSSQSHRASSLRAPANRRSPRGLAWLIAVAIGLLVPTSSLAEMYRWVDDEGKLHFTQDLHSVPPKHRRAADAKAKAGPDPSEASRIQTYSPPAAAAGAAAPKLRSSGSRSSGGDVHRIRVTQAGSSMRATVLINGRVNVPFILDTGASDVVLPSWAAEELGLDLSSARTQSYNTANGVISQPVTSLDSVKLGTAEVRNVPTSISDSMKTGLLGLSFFNHFKYDFDPGAGIVTLRDNDLAESGRLRGGRSRGQWTRAFASAHARITRGEDLIEDVPFSRSRKRARYEEALDELRRQLELLDGEADDAKVPFSWRD